MDLLYCTIVLSIYKCCVTFRCVTGEVRGLVKTSSGTAALLRRGDSLAADSKLSALKSAQVGQH